MVAIPVSIAQEICNLVADKFDAGASAGYIEFRDGLVPTPDNPATGTLLAQVNFSDPAFGNADANATATANAISSPNAVNTGTATYARGYDSDGNTVVNFSVGLAGSGADIIMSTLSITSGQPVPFASLTLTMPTTPA